VATLFDKAGGARILSGTIVRLLGVEPDGRSGRRAGRNFREVRFDGPALRRAAGLLDRLEMVTDRDRGNSLAAWLAAAPEIRAERWGSTAAQFLTQKLTPRVTLATKCRNAAGAWVETCLAEEQARVLALKTAPRRSGRGAMRAAALARLGHGFLAEYEKTKGIPLLDYDDLILATRGPARRRGKVRRPGPDLFHS